MLTIQQFTVFDTRARYDITMSLGIYLSSVHSRKAQVLFYSVYDFVVEVWKAPVSNKIIKVEAAAKKLYSSIYKSNSTCLN
jgi:CRISPR/Cas system-associated endonuclease Cas1